VEETSGVESLFLTLSIFDESFLLTPGFFPEKRRNICTATLWIVDWNISILRKSVNRNFQNGRVKEVGCLFHLPIFNWKMIWELMITDGNVETKKAEPN
jgi:hypothetical protein